MSSAEQVEDIDRNLKTCSYKKANEAWPKIILDELNKKQKSYLISLFSLLKHVKNDTSVSHFSSKQPQKEFDSVLGSSAHICHSLTLMYCSKEQLRNRLLRPSHSWLSP